MCHSLALITVPTSAIVIDRYSKLMNRSDFKLTKVQYGLGETYNYVTSSWYSTTVLSGQNKLFNTQKEQYK